jgi:hypothetical protein
MASSERGYTNQPMKDVRLVLVVIPHGIGDLAIIAPILVNLNERNVYYFICNSVSESRFIEKLNLKYGYKISLSSDLKSPEKIFRFSKIFFYKFDDIIIQYGVSRIKLFFLVLFLRISLSKKMEQLLSRDDSEPDKFSFFLNAVRGSLGDWVGNKCLMANLTVAETSVERLNLETDRVVVCCSVGGFSKEKNKRWPKQFYIQLGIRLANRIPNCDVVYLGDKGDMVDFSLDHGLGHEAFLNESRLVDLVGKTTLDEYLNLIEKCDLLVSNCNSASHLRALTFKDQVVLYGPTDPVITGVRNPKASCLVGKVECGPCYGTPRFLYCEDNFCMRFIIVDDVFEVCVDHLDSIRGH